MAESDTTAAISARDLNFSWGAAPVLAGLTMAVQPREIFGVVGADGAGKSTLLQLLIGQLSPASGEIRVLGRPLGAPGLREAIAYMPQVFGQYLDLSVLENLRFFASLHGLARAHASEVIADLLGRTGLAGFEHRRAAQLSGGMMQKLALACALVSRPRVMFLDEPTTGVDPLSRRAFWQLLEGVRAEGVAIVCTTANMEEAERCNRIGTLEHGRFTREGRPQALVEGVTAALIAVSGDAARSVRAPVRDLPGVDLVFTIGRDLRLWLREGADARSVCASIGALAPGLSTRRLAPRLHDVALRDLALPQREPVHA
jgi:ABC-2 type transport system ATP-binding protein